MRSHVWVLGAHFTSLIAFRATATQCDGTAEGVCFGCVACGEGREAGGWEKRSRRALGWDGEGMSRCASAAWCPGPKGKQLGGTLLNPMVV